VSAVAWALCAHFLLATALFLSNGHDQIVAFILLLLSCAAAACALGASPFPGGISERRVGTLTLCLAVASTLAAFLRQPGDFVSGSRAAYFALSSCALALVATYALEIGTGTELSLGRLARIRPYAMLAVAFALGAWMIHASPSPRIDVWPIHQQAAQALVSGRSPYSPGVIEANDSSHQGIVVRSYGYPPMNAVLTAVAYAATGETRWATLAAIVLGGYLLWLTARRGRRPGEPWPDLLLACFLFHPRGLFVVEQAWGDPLALPFLAGFALAAASGRRRLAAVLLGLLCSVKQHFAIYGVVLVLVPGIGVSGAVLALATAVATYVPFALASPRGLWTGLVELHTKGSFRADSLSLTAIIADAGFILPGWVGIVSTLAFLAAFLPRVPRKLGPLLLASAVSFLVFYVLGRQAFCNYYYVVCQTLLIAAAVL